MRDQAQGEGPPSALEEGPRKKCEDQRSTSITFAGLGCHARVQGPADDGPSQHPGARQR